MLNDLGSFTIPCTLGDSYFEKAFCDLGASINLMPLFVFYKLNIGEPKPLDITLQMANRFIKHPGGVIKDVLIKVGKFIFLVDFIVSDGKRWGYSLDLGKTITSNRKNTD